MSQSTFRITNHAKRRANEANEMVNVEKCDDLVIGSGIAVAFLMKDFVLLAVCFYLLKQDLLRLKLAPYRETVCSITRTSEIPYGADRKIA